MPYSQKITTYLCLALSLWACKSPDSKEGTEVAERFPDESGSISVPNAASSSGTVAMLSDQQIETFCKETVGQYYSGLNRLSCTSIGDGDDMGLCMDYAQECLSEAASPVDLSQECGPDDSPNRNPSCMVRECTFAFIILRDRSCQGDVGELKACLQQELAGLNSITAQSICEGSLDTLSSERCELIEDPAFCGFDDDNPDQPQSEEPVQVVEETVPVAGEWADEELEGGEEEESFELTGGDEG